MSFVLFAVGGSTQWNDALRVAAALPTSSRVLDLGTLEVVPPPPHGTAYPGRHWPSQGPRVVVELTRILRRMASDIDAVVLGQDAGRLQRVVASVARHAGIPIAVVPDGALFDAPATLLFRLRVQEAAFRLAGLTCGEPLRFGTTKPDLWCAWGPGWVPLLEQFSPAGRVVVTGSPRAADLVALPAAPGGPTQILVCSQPTWIHPFPPSATAGSAWYRWVDRILASSPPGAVRVRLHPRERDICNELSLSDAVRAALTVGNTLADDLAQSDAVVAPFSTVLIEAAAAGRKVLSVVPEHACLDVRTSSPAMADPDLQVRLVSEVDDFAAVVAELASHNTDAEWGSRYATVASDTADRCATAVMELVRASVRT